MGVNGLDRQKSVERCFVNKLANGKVIEVTEYCDTELVTRAFGR